MIDFSKVLADATEKAMAKQNRMVKAVTDEQVADKIIDMSKQGYIPNAQTPDVVRAYLSGCGIFLTGPAGTGKTFLMSLLAGTSSIQHSERDINDWGLNRIGDWYEWRDGLEVVVDDLGCERTAYNYGDKEDLLKLVIEHRYAAQKGRTHFTSNLTSAQISERYGERILDRILGMCNAFRMTGESYRRKPTVIK